MLPTFSAQDMATPPLFYKKSLFFLFLLGEAVATWSEATPIRNGQFIIGLLCGESSPQEFASFVAFLSNKEKRKGFKVLNFVSFKRNFR